MSNSTAMAFALSSLYTIHWKLEIRDFGVNQSIFNEQNGICSKYPNFGRIKKKRQKKSHNHWPTTVVGKQTRTCTDGRNKEKKKSVKIIKVRYKQTSTKTVWSTNRFSRPGRSTYVFTTVRLTPRQTLSRLHPNPRQQLAIVGVI